MMEAAKSEGLGQTQNVTQMAGGLLNDAMKHVSGPRPEGAGLANEKEPGPPPLIHVLDDVRRELSRCHETADELMRSVGRTT